MANKYDAMSITELEGEMAKLRTQKAAIQEQLREAHAIYDEKRAVQDAKNIILAMGDDEKRALLQAIEADGIQSAESFGDL